MELLIKNKETGEKSPVFHAFEVCFLQKKEKLYKKLRSNV